MANPFQKASRQQQPLRIAISGPSGSGKTHGALALARNLVGPGGSVAVIDTEAGSASLYADRAEFDVLNIRPPYLTTKYLEAIEAAIANGYQALVIDSISHQWDGEGGILQRKEEADAVPGSNHWTNWGPFTKEHNRFKSAILNCPIHLIVTLRSKMAYAQSENGGKKKVEKLGLQPIQREGMEYEFTVTFDVGMNHRASAGGAAGKDRTGLFDGKQVDLSSPATAKAFLDWLATSEPPPPPPSPAQYDELEQLAADPRWTAKQSAALLKRGRAAGTGAAMAQLIESAIEALSAADTTAADEAHEAQGVGA